MKTSTRDKLIWALWILFAIANAFLLIWFGINHEGTTWSVAATLIASAFYPFGLAIVIASAVETWADNAKRKRRKENEEKQKASANMSLRGSTKEIDGNAIVFRAEQMISDSARKDEINRIVGYITSYQESIKLWQNGIEEMIAVLRDYGVEYEPNVSCPPSGASK